MATTNPYSGTQIKQYIQDKGYIDADGKVTNAAAIYNDAKQYGVTGSQLDAAMGWGGGTADKWVNEAGYRPLEQQQPVANKSTPTAVYTPSKRTTVPGTTGGQSTPGMLRDWGMQGTQGAGNATAAGALSDAAKAASFKKPTYTPGTSTAGQAAQTKWDESMSAAGRLDSMLSSSSPLMQSAALRGRQAAARSGMLNSTMGAEAAQKAMIDSASPIAMADAQMFGQQAMQNTSESNKWNTLDLDRMQNDKQYAATNALQYQQLETEAKLKAAEMGLDWAKTQQSERMEFMKLAQQEGQYQQSFGLDSDRLDADLAQFAAKFGLEVDQLALNYDKMSQEDRQFYDKLIGDRQNLEYEWGQKFGIEKMAQNYKIDLTRLDGEIKKDLMTLENSFKKDIAGDENISNAWGLMMKEIGAIQNNPDLDPDAKRINIQNVLDGFGSFTSFWKKSTGGALDVSDLLSFGIKDVDETPETAAVKNQIAGEQLTTDGM